MEALTRTSPHRSYDSDFEYRYALFVEIQNNELRLGSWHIFPYSASLSLSVNPLIILQFLFLALFV